MVGPGMFLHPKFVYDQRITHVINVGEDEAAPSWVKRALGPRYAHLPISDDEKTQLDDIYPVFEKTLTRFLRERGRVYVHCMAGMNRSASLMALFVVRQMHLPLEAVVFHGLRQRPCMFANPSFNAQLIDLAKKHAKK
jgi:atypical dual specificity phosphatase